jgi:amidase
VDRVNLDLGLKPEEISPKFRNMVLSGAMGAGMAKYAEHMDKLMPYSQSFVKEAAHGEYGKENLLEAEELVKNLYKHIVDQVFAKGYDVMLAPTIGSPHMGNQFDWTVGPDHVEDGKNFTKTIPGLYTIPFNMLNWMPIVDVPTGLTRKNMPVGMQIIGPSFETETVFQFADAYSQGAPKFFEGDLFPTFKETD